MSCFNSVQGIRLHMHNLSSIHLLRYMFAWCNFCEIEKKNIYIHIRINEVENNRSELSVKNMAKIRKNKSIFLCLLKTSHDFEKESFFFRDFI